EGSYPKAETIEVSWLNKLVVVVQEEFGTYEYARRCTFEYHC
ncbi:hypothetical protein C5167_008273, partial [Papaver somniferum]